MDDKEDDNQIDCWIAPTTGGDWPDLCPKGCGGAVEYVSGGVYCERCGYKEAF